MSRLGHLLAIAGVVAMSAALALNASAWPGVVLASVGAAVVTIGCLAQWADAESADTRHRRTADQLEALERRLMRLGDTLDQRTAELTARLETAERRDALGRM